MLSSTAANFLRVALGGALGAITRYGVYLALPRAVYETPGFPFATLLINVTGCLVAGGLSVYAEKSLPYAPEVMLFFMTGFLGSYTTFSAFGVETVGLLRHTLPVLAALNITLNVFLGCLAVWLGRLLGSFVL